MILKAKDYNDLIRCIDLINAEIDKISIAFGLPTYSEFYATGGEFERTNGCTIEEKYSYLFVEKPLKQAA